MKNTFFIFSPPNRFLMVPIIVLDFPNVARGNTNVFWYYNDDLGLVGMSIYPKKVFYRSIPNFLCNSCVTLCGGVKGKYTENQNFQKILKMWFKCPLTSPKRSKTFWKCSGVFGDVKNDLTNIFGPEYYLYTRTPPPWGGSAMTVLWSVP